LKKPIVILLKGFSGEPVTPPPKRGGGEKKDESREEPVKVYEKNGVPWLQFPPENGKRWDQENGGLISPRLPKKDGFTSRRIAYEPGQRGGDKKPGRVKNPCSRLLQKHPSKETTYLHA